jgi:hypothetical protein
MRHQTPSEYPLHTAPAPLPGNSTRPAARSIDAATLELLATWQQQDATTDPTQIRAADQEIADFRKAMNDARIASGDALLFP